MSYELSDMGGGDGAAQQVANPTADGAVRSSRSLDFEPEPEPSGGVDVPEPMMQPEVLCGETTQIIGVDENSPVAWSADALLLAFAARDYGIYIATRTETGFTLATTLIGSRSSIKKLAFHPRRRLLVSANEQGIKLWAVYVDPGSSNNPSNQCRLVHSLGLDSTVRTHDAAVETVEWLFDGAFLATGSKDNSVKIWQLQEVGSSPEDCRLRYMETLDSHKASVLALAFSAVNDLLASCGRDSVIKVWNCDTLKGEALARRADDSGVTLQLVQNLEGHRGDVVSVAWSETGNTLVSGARDNTIKIWSPYGSECLRTLKAHKGDVHGLAMVPGGLLWSAATDGHFKLWKLLPEQSDSILDMADADAAAMLDVETMVRAMLEEGDEEVALLTDGIVVEKDTMEASLLADEGGIMSAALCGPFLATYVESLNAVRIWNVEDITSPRMIQEFMGHREAVHQVIALSQNRIISAGGDPFINVYDTATVARIATMAFDGSVNDLAVAPDERLLFAAGTERDVKVYNLTTLQGGGVVNQPVALFSGHCAKIFTLAISEDGCFLVTAAQDFDMKTWRVDEAKLLAVKPDEPPIVVRPEKLLEAHASAVASLAFNSSTSADQCYLASGGTDHRLAIWSGSLVASGRTRPRYQRCALGTRKQFG
jgi:WD40 repeat protein